jgi:outer membrane receptor protein involved in Fe transport
LNWEGCRWGFGWGTQYFDDVLMAGYYSISAAQLSDRAPWALNHDVTVSYRTSANENARGFGTLFSDSSITLGIKNVLNREPRFWVLSTDYGVAPYDSMMGREVWLQLRKSFK